jgi:hypothetical protein
VELLEMYSALQRGEITVDQAAAALKIRPRDMRARMTRWGHRLPLLLATLDNVRHNNIDRDTAADTLSVTPREVNMLMARWHVQRNLTEATIRKAGAQVKWEIRKKFAIDYIAGSTEIEEASEAAGVSTRQMRRWVSELLNKHFGMVFKDLRALSLKRRHRLADEIETAEGLELAKQNVLNSIATGKKSLQDEAIERALAKRNRHVRSA